MSKIRTLMLRSELRIALLQVTREAVDADYVAVAGEDAVKKKPATR